MVENEFSSILLYGNATCTPPAIDDFPRDLFTDSERRDGGFILHIIASLYLFAALAVVCDKYFVPAVEKICHALNMSNDVAGATFMAAATSAPELFVNVIGTFITEGDIGIGTIVGSAVFNILAVAACCGIAAGIVVPLDWWPLTRDCIAYGITVSILICIIHDERVEWYEALILVLLYFVYIIVMYYDKKLQKCAKGRVEKVKNRSIRGNRTQIHLGRERELYETNTVNSNGSIKRIDSETGVEIIEQKSDVIEPKTISKHITESDIVVNESAIQPSKDKQDENPPDKDDDEKEPDTLTTFPKKKKFWRQIVWIVVWPIRLVFFLTIPDCERPSMKKLFPLTFLMCIVWIGSLSYLVAWMITIIGHTLRIPDSVMGITFLAAGTSVPEAVSSVIVAKQGHGSMGISNSIGSNTFDILLCLGLPWLIKAAFLPIRQGQHWVEINSSGLEYSAISLLSTLFMLYLAFYLNNFKLDKKVGYACLLMYGVFLVLASLIELNVFFTVNLPTCMP